MNYLQLNLRDQYNKKGAEGGSSQFSQLASMSSNLFIKTETPLHTLHNPENYLRLT